MHLMAAAFSHQVVCYGCGCWRSRPTYSISDSDEDIYGCHLTPETGLLTETPDDEHLGVITLPSVLRMQQALHQCLMLLA